MPFTIRDIASALGAEAEGDLSLEVLRASEPQSAGPQDLALAMDPRYADGIAKGQARAAMLWPGADWRALFDQRRQVWQRIETRQPRGGDRLAGQLLAPGLAERVAREREAGGVHRRGQHAVAVSGEAERHLEARRATPTAARVARDLAGGAAVVLMWKLLGTSDYLGLGVPVIVRAFEDPHLPVYAFAAKLVFTAVTLTMPRSSSGSVSCICRL